MCKTRKPEESGAWDRLGLELAPRVARSIGSVRLTCLDSWGGR